MNLACTRARWLLQQKAAGLSSASGLFLEEHLQGCRECQESGSLLSGLTALHTEGLPVLTLQQREQVISRALRQAGRAKAAGSAIAYRVPSLGVGAFALAGLAAAAFALFMMRSSETHLPPTAAMDPRPSLAASVPAAKPAAQLDSVQQGELERAGKVLHAGDRFAANEVWQTRAGAALTLAHARVELLAGSSLSWKPTQHALELVTGSVQVDVDPTQHRAFAVITPEFTVHVLGTRFTVSHAGVVVEHGRVRVSAPDGTELALLEGQSQWHLPAEPRGAAEAARLNPNTKPSGTRNEPTPQAQLEQARRQLAAREVARARSQLSRVLAQPISNDLRAEALSLRAEAELMSREHAAARDTYLEVYRRFPTLPAAQTALFAAARVEAEHGAVTRAAAYFKEYLSRYPQGRFVKEASARLATLQLEPAP